MMTSQFLRIQIKKSYQFKFHQKYRLFSSYLQKVPGRNESFKLTKSENNRIWSIAMYSTGQDNRLPETPTPPKDHKPVNSVNSTSTAISQHFAFSQSFTRSEEWTSKFINSMFVYSEFVSPDEEKSLMKEIEPFISRLHYEEAHWDDAIHSYRETERSVWNKSNNVIMDRIRAIGFPPPVRQLKLVHVLDLAKKGVIKPHIDSVRFCGNTIAGVSLLSDCIMRLRHETQKDFYCDVRLPQRSLYVMNDFVRYEFTHEVMGENDSKFKNEVVPRDRRISIICRNEPEESPGPVFEQIFASESSKP